MAGITSKGTLAAIFLALICLMLAVLIWGSHSKPSTDELVWSKSRACNLTLELTGLVNVNCLLINVAESIDDSPIYIAASILTKAGKKTEEPPLVYLPGGPGAANNSSGDMLNYWANWYYQTDFINPFIVLDYRGLAPSMPAPECLSYKQAGIQNLSKNLTLQQDADILNPEFERCLTSINKAAEAAGVNNFLASLSSVQLAQDVKTALKRVGYTSWNILGVSYGSRVALVSALTQPEVNKVILDSPYVFSLSKASDASMLWARALDQFFLRCKKSPECWRKFSKKFFWELVHSVENNPITITSENWLTGQTQSWVLNDIRLVGMLFSILYAGEYGDERVALILSAIKTGQIELAQTEFDIFYNLMIEPSFREWFYLVVSCNDQVPESSEEFKANTSKMDKRWQALVGQFLDQRTCKSDFLRSAPLPTMKPLKLPLLVAVGEFDPVTPAEHASELRQYMDQGAFITLPGMGHSVFYASECGREAIARFLTQETYTKLESDINHCFQSAIHLQTP